MQRIPKFFQASLFLGLLVLGEQSTRAQSVSVPLEFNWNGLLHLGEGDQPDELDGYRSMSDLGVVMGATSQSLADFLVSETGLVYEIEPDAYDLDMVYLGNRNTVNFGTLRFDEEENTGSVDIGVQPVWLSEVDQFKPQVTQLVKPVPLDSTSVIGVLYMVSGQGGSFQMQLGFKDGSSVKMPLRANSMSGNANEGPPIPAIGVKEHNRYGPFQAAVFADSGIIAPDTYETIHLTEAIITAETLQSDLQIDVTGRELTSITFSEASRTTAAYGVLAVSVVPFIKSYDFQNPTITEFMVHNENGLESRDGERYDWVEILNTTERRVNFLGWYLTDEPNDLTKWRFPNFQVDPGGYVTVYASGKNITGSETHTNFKLSEGDYLALVRPDGETVVSAFQIPAQVKDISYGRSGDALEEVGYMGSPTPGGANEPVSSGVIFDTSFSTDRGFYTEPFFVTLNTEPPGGLIRYTIDGSEPTPTRGRLYSGPVPISTTTVLRAVGYGDNRVPSNVDTQTYIFPDHVALQPEMDQEVVNDPANSDSFMQDLQSLPVVSIAVDETRFFGFNGIYTNFDDRGRGAEVPVSMEYFEPGSDRRFQIDAGIRIHGGQARAHLKKPLRLYFRGEYGATRLRFPLFPKSRIDSFDNLILRGGGHDSWAVNFGGSDDSLAYHATYLRDQFMRATENDMGIVSPRGIFVSLYINGRFWGMYNLQERPDREYFADWFGGENPDWDVIKSRSQLQDGTIDAWNAFTSLARRVHGTPGALDSLRPWIDYNAYIDHMMLRMWAADNDWVGPVYKEGEDSTRFFSKNWFAGRDTRGGGGPFRFFTWDAEISMGQDLFVGPKQNLDYDLTRLNKIDSPAAAYTALRFHPEFRRMFADRVQKQMLDGGAMSVPRMLERFQALKHTIDPMMAAESARWGRAYATSGLASASFTKQEHWANETRWIEETFIPARTDIFLQQLRDAGMYPKVDPPHFKRHGGKVPSGFRAEMTVPEGQSGQIYYTTNGSDPATSTAHELLELVGDDADGRYLVPSTTNGGSGLGSSWRGVDDPPNIGEWGRGKGPFGYDHFNAYTADIRTNTEQEMLGARNSIYLRYAFNVTDLDDINELHKLLLQLRFDDGFIAYLNGERVARHFAIPSAGWTSSATYTYALSNDEGVGMDFWTFDITEHRDKVRRGTNVLAIHGLNFFQNIYDGGPDYDFIMHPKLVGQRITREARPTASANLYTGAIPVYRDQSIRARFRSATGEWSAMTEASFIVDQIANADNIVVSELHYNPLEPDTDQEKALATSENDFEYLELMNISGERVNIAGLEFTDGISYRFEPGVRVEVQPGERILLVSNYEAFRARHPTVSFLRIYGEYEGQLSNAGEQVTLRAANGDIIKSFLYDDAPPWPTVADGEGASLVLNDPVANPDPAIAANWRPSRDAEGSPGGDDTLRYSTWLDEGGTDLTDLQRRNLPLLMVFAVGAELVPHGSPPLAPHGDAFTGVTIGGDGTGGGEQYLHFSFRRRVGVGGVRFYVEFSDDYVDWERALVGGESLPPLDSYCNNDGTETVLVRDPQPISASATGHRYVRLRVTE